MKETSQLLPGNLILIKDEAFDEKCLHTVNGVLEDEVTVFCNGVTKKHPSSDITPIRITEDIIYSLGFEKTANSLFEHGGFKAEFDKENSAIIITHVENNQNVNLKYVHLFQNMFKTIFGTNLNCSKRRD